MDANNVIEVIKRRQGKFRQRSNSRSSPNLNEADRIDLAIADEYDSLMAELETLGAMRPNRVAIGHVRTEQKGETASKAAANHESGSKTDDLVLGDQGQSGG